MKGKKKEPPNPTLLRTQIYNMQRRAAAMPPGKERDKLEQEIAEKQKSLEQIAAK